MTKKMIEGLKGLKATSNGTLWVEITGDHIPGLSVLLYGLGIGAVGSVVMAGLCYLVGVK